LVLWVVRVPATVVVIGFLLYGAAPQAQDLLLPLVDSDTSQPIVLFFVLHFVFWAMTVHYSARILVKDDDRLYARVQQHPSAYFDLVQRWVPRLLGGATFAALLLSAFRAEINLPVIKDHWVTDTLRDELDHFKIWCVIAFAVFIFYTMV